MKNVLEFINNKMSELEIPYQYNEWSKDDTYPYFVGNYTQDNIEEEDGHTPGTLTVDGWTRGTVLDLINYGDKICTNFTDLQEIYGGHLFYTNSYGIQTIETGEEGLKRIRITIHVETWEDITWD